MRWILLVTMLCSIVSCSDSGTPPLSSHKTAPPIPKGLIVFEVQNYTANEPWKCSYEVNVKYVGDRPPNEDELMLLAKYLKEKGANVPRTFVRFWLDQVYYEASQALADVEFVPDKIPEVHFFHKPDLLSELTQEKFGLSLQQRVRWWVECLRNEDIHSEQSSAVLESLDHPILAQKKENQDLLNLISESEEKIEKEIDERYGVITEEQKSEMINEAVKNSFPAPVDLSEIDALIRSLPEPPERN